MSQHKTGQSNWSAEDKKLYDERRQKNLRGQAAAITVHKTITDEQGKLQIVPLGVSTGATISRSKQPSARAQRREKWKAYRREERRRQRKTAGIEE